MMFLMLDDGVVGIWILVNIFGSILISFVLEDLFHFKGKICQKFCSPKLGNFFLHFILYVFIFSLFFFMMKGEIAINKNNILF